MNSLQRTVASLKEQLAAANRRAAHAPGTINFGGVVPHPPPRDSRSPRTSTHALTGTLAANACRSVMASEAQASPRTSAKAAPTAKDKKIVMKERLKELDPTAAAQAEERQAQLTQLRERLQKAHAQTAVEAMSQTLGTNLAQRARAEMC